MDTLFEENSSINLRNVPLAERMRPLTLSQIKGQEHLVGTDGLITKMIQSGKVRSMILWGEPGTGKTTLARIIANQSKSQFILLSALDSGLKELRESLRKAEINFRKGLTTILFIDEIHRFNKTQQDGLLSAVEKGHVIFIGATTENPSFEVNNALLSRCTVLKLNNLNKEAIIEILNEAIEYDNFYKDFQIDIEDIGLIAELSSGDARKALVILENLIETTPIRNKKYKITNADISSVAQKSLSKYDKKGEFHYDIISAFIKSMRGSDPDAAVFWLAKMLDSGEDPIFIARRMVVFASEDIGNSDTQAIQVAVAVAQACQIIGMPECRINLAQAATYLASTHKSNASYMAIEDAMEYVKSKSQVAVPMHLRNSPTKLMKEQGYGKGYEYPHNFPNNFIKAEYLPKEVQGKKFYNPSNNGTEAMLKHRLQTLWEL